ncbi:MAG: hypothetical protein FWC55_09585, partial [Firmicutes bacterium]|nr:hypothetical protein [Bacillota bacterium]
LEIQEPTDLTLRAERSTPSGLRIGDELCHLGVGYDKMFARINYQGFTEQEVRRRFQIRPVTVASGDGFREDILIGPSRTDCFSMRRLTVSETCPYRNTADRFVIAAALSGEGVLRHGGREIPILPGNRLFLPACVKETAFTARGAGALVLVLCFPRAL